MKREEGYLVVKNHDISNNNLLEYNKKKKNKRKNKKKNEKIKKKKKKLVEEEEKEEEKEVEVEVEGEGEGEIGGCREVMRGKRRGSSKGYLQEEVEKMERPLAISFEREKNPVG
ncbi:hypothetical protein HZH68_007228 [Vespula germanica]|uniref:Uncharacterized protein n=1 Tax=Vespula germanica TaxID=30212 RepID=A0A834K749_VESGE|nr:hypothetical protein HZH68_007228 [Vespula germanica]